MHDVFEVIAHNTMNLLESQNKKREDLATATGLTKQDVNKILSGERIVSSIELHKIADYLEVSVEELVTQHQTNGLNVIQNLMSQAGSDAARTAIAIADELAEMIIFHARVRENSTTMMEIFNL